MLENDQVDEIGGAFKKCPGAIPLCLVLLHHHPLCPFFLCDLVVFQLHLQWITTSQHLDPRPPVRLRNHALTVSFACFYTRTN